MTVLILSVARPLSTLCKTRSDPVMIKETVSKDSGFLWHDAASMGKLFLAFQRNVMSSSPRVRSASSWTSYLWRCRRNFPSKHQEPLNKQCSITFQKSVIFIYTTVRTSKFAKMCHLICVACILNLQLVENCVSSTSCFPQLMPYTQCWNLHCQLKTPL